VDHRHLHWISARPTLFPNHPQLAGSGHIVLLPHDPWLQYRRGNRVNRPAQVLAAMFQGGGNIPLLMPVMAGLVARGHHLRILAGPGVRRSRLPISESLTRRMAASGAEVVPFQEPDRHPHDRLRPPRGLIGGWVPKQFQTITYEAQTLAWASAWAENVTAELRPAYRPTSLSPITSCSARSPPRRPRAFRR
jgi:hypothetical protein